MKILFVISGLGLGGAERQLVLLSRELIQLGHQVSIYTLTGEVPRIDELSDIAVDVIVDQKRRKLDFGVVRRLRLHIKAWCPDIIHGFLYDGDIYSRLSAVSLGKPVLNSERSDKYSVSLLQRTGYLLTAGLCDGIVANSHAGAEFARRLHKMPAEKVHVVWNGINLEEIDARLVRSQQPARQVFLGSEVKRLCMVGAIKPSKDHRLALHVIRCLVDSDPSWRLICVGDELSEADRGYKMEVLAERDRLQLEPFVKFVGHRRDVPELIASADLLLVTSLHEGFPNVVLEAMACGTAVVSTDYSDVRRILPGAWQVVGSRVDREIAAAVKHCYQNRSAIATAQRHWVGVHATSCASADALLAVYEKYVAPSQREAESAPI